MNLFILDQDPFISATFHIDRHVVKMPTETAQMISFVYHDQELWNKPIPDFVMKFSKSHYKHPCSVWIRESLSNFLYACTLGLALYQEYQYRYNNPEKHKRAFEIMKFGLTNPPNLPDKGLTKFALAMDETYKLCDNPIENYREYYRKGKQHLHSWKNRPKPIWL
jgi:hypothetical protein